MLVRVRFNPTSAKRRKITLLTRSDVSDIMRPSVYSFISTTESINISIEWFLILEVLREFYYY
jgi:hypothetical protein